jgi:hypothetical protein
MWSARQLRFLSCSDTFALEKNGNGWCFFEDDGVGDDGNDGSDGSDDGGDDGHEGGYGVVIF